MVTGLIERVHAPATIEGGEGLLAIIVRREFRESGVTFFTEPDQPQQVAYMRRPAGEIVPAHSHLSVPRKIHRTQEVLLVRSGSMLVKLFSSDRELVCSRVLTEGDLIVLVGGGHSLQMLEDVELVEIKQGPYLGRGEDKVSWTLPEVSWPLPKPVSTPEKGG